MSDNFRFQEIPRGAPTEEPRCVEGEPTEGQCDACGYYYQADKMRQIGRFTVCPRCRQIAAGYPHVL